MTAIEQANLIWAREERKGKIVQAAAFGNQNAAGPHNVNHHYNELGGDSVTHDSDGGRTKIKLRKKKEGWVADRYSEAPKEEGFTYAEGHHVGSSSMTHHEAATRANKIAGAKFIKS